MLLLLLFLFMIHHTQTWCWYDADDDDDVTEIEQQVILFLPFIHTFIHHSFIIESFTFIWFWFLNKSKSVMWLTVVRREFWLTILCFSWYWFRRGCMIHMYKFIILNLVPLCVSSVQNNPHQVVSSLIRNSICFGTFFFFDVINTE